MSDIENLGNRELYECFFALQLRVYHSFKIDGLSNNEFNNDPRTDLDSFYLPKNFFREQNDLYLNLLTKAKKTGFGIFAIDELSEDNKYDLALYILLEQEITRRGFSIDDTDLALKMERTPTYIREIFPTNDIAEHPIDLSKTNHLYDDLIIFDYPVRQACRILNGKGYDTYWSSANIDDFKNRRGHVIKDKNVAYILIDSNNLTEELKNELFLDGECKFWGLALSHADNGKYYGIWAEITSADMKCDDLSKVLSEKALALPELKIEKAFYQKR